LAYTYQISPPVPSTDIRVVGVNLNLLASKDVDPHAIAALLPVLYSPQIASRFTFPILEDKMLTASGFPISDGTEMYIASKQPLITAQMIDQVKGIFGLIMSLLSVALVVFKWFKAPDDIETAGADEADSEDGSSSVVETDSEDRPNVTEHIGNITTTISKLE